eukprot:5813233-Amphidinium_carterae.1
MTNRKQELTALRPSPSAGSVVQQTSRNVGIAVFLFVLQQLCPDGARTCSKKCEKISKGSTAFVARKWDGVPNSRTCGAHDTTSTLPWVDPSPPCEHPSALISPHAGIRLRQAKQCESPIGLDVKVVPHENGQKKSERKLKNTYTA